jgi:hypothetical protein
MGASTEFYALSNEKNHTRAGRLEVPSRGGARYFVTACTFRLSLGYMMTYVRCRNGDLNIPKYLNGDLRSLWFHSYQNFDGVSTIQMSVS